MAPKYKAFLMLTHVTVLADIQAPNESIDPDDSTLEETILNDVGQEEIRYSNIAISMQAQMIHLKISWSYYQLVMEQWREDSLITKSQR